MMIETLESRMMLAAGPRQMEYLDRGVVATRVSSTQAFISWRSLVTDTSGMGFNLYRSANGGAVTKLNPSVITAGTNYTDSSSTSTTNYTYYVKPVVSGVEQTASPTYTLPANTTSGPLVADIAIRNLGTGYSVRHISVGDLNGDGKYDYIVDRIPPTVNEVATQPEYIEAYSSDGAFMWAVNAGPNSYDLDNIEPGASAIDIGNWDGVTVYDLDGDGFAEVLYRSAHGVVFGDGAMLNYPASNDAQFMSVIDGRTGAERAHIQLPFDFIFDGPLAASLGIGYLDGVHPSLVAKMKNRIGTGNFNQMFVAYDYNGTNITQKWKYITDPVDSDNGHNIRIVDVNQDGIDELCDTALCINGDGTLRYNLRNGTPSIGHGDRFQIGDLDPNRPGLEGYCVQQNNSAFLYEAYYDASTGEVLHSHFGTALADIGRGIAADVDPNYPGYEYWSFSGIYNSYTATTGTAPIETQLTVDPNRPWPNFRVWWDGDVLSENLNDTVIDKWNPATQTAGRVTTLYHYGSPYSTSGEAPIFYGDILGDWREEVIFERSDHTAIEIYSTQISSSTRLYALSQNPEYRNCMTVKGYYQSNMIDYYLGAGMTTPAMPNITVLGSGATAPKVATAASASANPVSGTTVNLSVLGLDDAGESGLTYTWSVNGNAGVTFSANNTNAAKNTLATFSSAGTYIFTVTLTDATGKKATSNVQVVVNQVLSSIKVTPAVTTVASNANRQFFAIGLDQYGQSLTTQPTFTWAVSRGVGTIDSAGIYTPAGTSGSAIVAATSGSISSTSAITIAATAPSAPTSLSATAVSSSQINLTWADASANEQIFLIEISQDGINFSQVATANPNATSAYITGLNVSTLYYFRVRSYNTSGASFPTAIASATTFFANSTWWKLDETIGTTVPEASGNGTSGLTYNGPVWTSGKFGNALSFDGVDDYAQLPNNTASTASGSVSIWFKTGSNFSDYAILFYMASDTYGNGLGSQSELHLNLTSGEKLQLYIRGSATGLWDHDVNITSAASYNNNAWHHAVATWQAGASASLYVDGVSAGTSTFTPVFTFSNTERTYLSRTSNNTNKFTGLMDDVRLFNTSLTASQVQRLATGNQSPSIATAASTLPINVTGTTAALSALGADDAGEAGLSYIWTLKDGPATTTFSTNSTNGAKNSTATFTAAGIYTFAVTIKDASNLATTSFVTVTVANTPTGLSITTPGPTVAPGQSLLLTSTTLNQFGASMTSRKTFWTIISGGGQLDSQTGLFIADASSSTTVVECTDFILSPVTTTITIAGSAPTITSATATPSTVTGKTTQLAVVATDDAGETNLTYAWSIISQPSGARVPTFSTNAAKNAIATFYKAGTYTLRVTTTDALGQTSFSNVNVTVSQTLTSVIVSPGNFKVTVNTQQTFKAVGYDQFGLTMSAQPTFTWTATTGSINSTGLFTAGATANQTVTITATSGGKSGTVNITTKATGKPLAPSNLAAKLNSGNLISLTWRDNSTDETSFEIQYGTGTAVSNVSWTTSISTTAKQGAVSTVTYNIASAFATGATYYFRVRAINASGASSWSNVMLVKL